MINRLASIKEKNYSNAFLNQQNRLIARFGINSLVSNQKKHCPICAAKNRINLLKKTNI